MTVSSSPRAQPRSTTAGTMTSPCAGTDRSRPGVRAGDAQVVGEDHRLDAVAGADLGEYPADVGLHGRLGQDEAFGDLAVGPAVADGHEDLSFTVGQGEPAR